MLVLVIVFIAAIRLCLAAASLKVTVRNGKRRVKAERESEVF